MRVTLPSVVPALAAGWLVSLISAIGLFSVPSLIGTIARFDVLSVYIFRLLNTFPPRTGTALALAGVMLVVVQVLLVAQRWLLPGGRFATVGGRGFRVNRVTLGRWGLLARGGMLFYLLFAAILPVAGLLFVSLQPFWTPSVQWERLSLENYRVVLFDNPITSARW